MSNKKRANVIFGLTITFMMVPWFFFAFILLAGKASENTMLESFGAFVIFGAIGSIAIIANYIVGVFS